MSMENILELQQVSKTFSKSNFALENVTFSLPYGSILGFVGENGAGKTTTIGCILNTIAKDSGMVKLFGKEMTDADTDMRERIGVVYDGDNFPAYWTAAQLAKVMSGFYKQWDNILFQKFLREYKLPANQKIKQYSRGMTMKLAIAVALSHHPQLLILDEATGGLDPVVRDEMLDTFLDFVQEEDHSILLSSHITSDLEKVADYITFIHNGKLIMTVSKNDLVYNYAVMRCKENQFLALDPADIIVYRKRDFQIDVLVSDCKAMQRKYKEIVIDHVSVDEIFLLFMFAMGIAVIIIPDQTWQMYFIIIGIVGLAVNAATVIGNEFSSKWGKYKLTLPVKRIDIVKSLYINQLLWIMIGVLFVGIIIALSYLLHGITFEQFEGISGVLVIGISISLTMGAIFIPMVYLAGEDKTIVFLIISLICALGIATMLFNIPLFGPFILIGCSILLFIVSFPLTVGIFKKKEY